MYFSDHPLEIKTNGTTLRPLYPYRSDELSVFFVYGKDFQRQLNLFVEIPKPIKVVASLIVLFVSLAAIVLHFIRRTFGLPRDDLVSTHIDCWIPFIGGGNLAIQHRFERWFFGMLLFSAFFIMSVFAGDLLDSAIKVLNQKISTFEQLAQLNSPIAINPALIQDSNMIHEMLR